MSEIKLNAIIVAGGSGTRMGHNRPKQYLLLDNHTILWHSIQAFVNTFENIQIIVVVHHDYLDQESSYQQAFPTHHIRFVEAGAERFYSTNNGLHACPDSGIVFVHDAVRPLITSDLLVRLMAETEIYGNAVPYLPLTDSIRLVDNDVNTILDRSKVVKIQTPQVFQLEELKSAFQQYQSSQFTDESSVMEQAGHPIHLVLGEVDNIKITTPEDLEWVRWKINRE